jgi:hypothetical protein
MEELLAQLDNGLHIVQVDVHSVLNRGRGPRGSRWSRGHRQQLALPRAVRFRAPHRSASSLRPFQGETPDAPAWRV